LILVIFLSLIFIAVFSAAETSFVAADKVALTIDHRSKFETNSIFFFVKENEKFFATVVVASSLSLTTFSSASEVFFHEDLKIGTTLLLPLTTVIGFLFGELVPKSLALESPEGLSRFMVPFVRAFYFVTKPLVDFTAVFSKFVAQAVFRSTERTVMFQKRDVYRLLANTVTGGYLDKIESDIIRRLLANANQPVRSFMVPRTQLVAADIHTGTEKLREIFEKTGKTKIIIYDSSIDNVIGVIHARDVFKDAKTIDELISDVLFVPESISALDVLQEFRTERVYCAMVIDEFGGTAGLVTSSDIMEAFLGDVAIWSTGDDIKLVGGKQYILRGDAAVSEVEKALDVRFPEGDFITVSGMIVTLAGGIPIQGERIYVGGLEFQILKADGRRVDEVKLVLK
jgi:CBS domain containing-hemolysin-like protein